MTTTSPIETWLPPTQRAPAPSVTRSPAPAPRSPAPPAPRSPTPRDSGTEMLTGVRRRRRIPVPNIADRFFDLIEPLTALQRNALIQHLADDYYIVNRPPTRQDVIELIAHTIPNRPARSPGAKR